MSARRALGLCFLLLTAEVGADGGNAQRESDVGDHHATRPAVDTRNGNGLDVPGGAAHPNVKSSPGRSNDDRWLGFATNQGSDTVSVFDLKTQESLATVPVGQDPAGVAIARDGRRVFITTPTGHGVSVINTTTLVEEARLSMPGEVLGIVADPVRDRVYVNDWYGQRVHVIDTRTLRPIHSAATGKVPAGLAVSRALELLVVACRDDNALCLHRLPSLERVATVAVGRAPFGVTLDAAGTRAYVANVQSDSVSVVDLATARVIADIAVGDSPYATALDESRHRLVVTNQQAGSLSVVDLRTMKTTRTIAVAEYPEGIAYSPALDQYFVASWFENVMLVFSGRDLTQTASLACGDGPRAFGDFIRPPAPRAGPP